MARNHVFVLGAGASKEAGAPVMREFFARAEDLHEAHLKSCPNRHAEIAQDFELVQRGRSALQLAHSKTQIDLENVEAVFSAFEMARSLQLDLRPLLDANTVAQLPDAIRRVIVRTLQWSMPLELQPGTALQAPATYAQFVNLIRALKERGASGRPNVQLRRGARCCT